jgi:hypothetical protein
MSDRPGAELEREALRLNDRYLDEAVIAFGLCPWADRAITGGELRRTVVAGEAPSLAAALAFIDELALAGAAAPVGMLIFARAEVASPGRCGAPIASAAAHRGARTS